MRVRHSPGNATLKLHDDTQPLLRVTPPWPWISIRLGLDLVVDHIDNVLIREPQRAGCVALAQPQCSYFSLCAEVPTATILSMLVVDAQCAKI